MKRRLILHLGLWKTGTTTVQTFLRRNPALLAAADAFYPRVLPDSLDHPWFGSHTPTRWITSEINHQALGEEIMRRGRARAGTSIATPLWDIAFQRIKASGAGTAIISYEDFSARTASYRFDAIRAALLEFDVQGLIYLRPQEDWAVSLYAHMVRGARYARPFGDFVETLAPRLTYSALLDTILDCIPLDSLVVRDFDEAAASGLIGHFVCSAGLDMGPLRAADARAVSNRSLPNWAVIFLQVCRQGGIEGENFARTVKALQHVIATAPAPALAPGLDVASPLERQMLRDVAAADADRLMRGYGVRLATRTRPSTPYRTFDETDFRTIRALIAPELPDAVRTALMWM